MLTKSFGKLGWPVSAVGLGAWNIGNQWGEIDDATAWQTVRAAYDAGMTLFDVAESYGLPNGLSETRVGQALSGVRHNVIVVSKIGNWGQRSGCGIPKTGVDSIRISGHAILGRLRTDWVDVILCHKGDLADPTIYLEGFEALKDEGLLAGVRHFDQQFGGSQALQSGRHVQCGAGGLLAAQPGPGGGVPALLQGARHRGDGAGALGEGTAIRSVRERRRFHRLGAGRLERGRRAAGAIRGGGRRVLVACPRSFRPGEEMVASRDSLHVQPRGGLGGDPRRQVGNTGARQCRGRQPDADCGGVDALAGGD